MAGQLRGLRRQFTAAHLPVDEFNQKLDPETLDALEPGFRRSGAGAAESQGSPAEPRAPIASANPPRTRTMPGDRAEQIRRWNAAPAGTRFVFPDGTEATK
jgi:hypothetical protein